MTAWDSSAVYNLKEHSGVLTTLCPVTHYKPSQISVKIHFCKSTGLTIKAQNKLYQY